MLCAQPLAPGCCLSAGAGQQTLRTLRISGLNHWSLNAVYQLGQDRKPRGSHPGLKPGLNYWSPNSWETLFRDSHPGSVTSSGAPTSAVLPHATRGGGPPVHPGPLRTRLPHSLHHTCVTPGWLGEVGSQVPVLEATNVATPTSAPTARTRTGGSKTHVTPCVHTAGTAFTHLPVAVPGVQIRCWLRVSCQRTPNLISDSQNSLQNYLLESRPTPYTGQGSVQEYTYLPQGCHAPGMHPGHMHPALPAPHH
jgi:hypothetical protein